MGKERLQGEGAPSSGTEQWDNTSQEPEAAVWETPVPSQREQSGGAAAVRSSSVVSIFESPALLYTFVIVAVTVPFLISVSSKLFSTPDLCLLCFQFSSPLLPQGKREGKKVQEQERGTWFGEFQ